MGEFFKKDLATLTAESSSFFSGSSATEEQLVEAQSKFNRLYRQLQKAGEELNEFKNLGYGAGFIPAPNTQITYTGRGNGGSYDAYSGLIPNDESQYTSEVKIDTKKGTTEFISGYVPDLGSIIVRQIEYNIINNKMNICPIQEFLVPIVNNGNSRKTIVKRLSTGTIDICSYCPTSTIGRLNCTPFLNMVYGTARTNRMTFDQYFNYISRNKSFEIIWRTISDPQDFDILMGIQITEPLPLHKVFHLEKPDFDAVCNKGLLKDFIPFWNDYLNNPTFFIKKTIPQWVKILEACKRWEEDLTFNNCSWGNSYYSNTSLFSRLIYAYTTGYTSSYGGRPNCKENVISSNYSFMKFANYVVQGTQDQGYTEVGSFMNLLADYLKMSEQYKVTPTLYSSTIQTTHDILARNHKIAVSAQDEIKFKARYDSFVPYKKGDYIISKPENTVDILREGDYLNHCVFSYVKRIINGENLVVFLRKKEDPNTPLITVEIRNNAIVQARGMHNNSIAQEYIDFLKEYADAQKMEISENL